MEENNNVNVTVEEPKKPKKKAPILTIILIIIIIGLLGLLGYTNKDKLFDKKEPAKTEEKKTNEKNNNNNNNNNNSKNNEPIESERNKTIFANRDKPLDINNTPFKDEYSINEDENDFYKLYFNDKLLYDSANDENMVLRTLNAVYELNYNGTIYYAYVLDANPSFFELKIVDQSGNIIYSKNLWIEDCGGGYIFPSLEEIPSQNFSYDVSNKKLYIYEAPTNYDDEFVAYRIKVEILSDNTVKLDRENKQEFDAVIGQQFC